MNDHVWTIYGVDITMQITLGNIGVALTVLLGTAATLGFLIKFGSKLVLYLDLMFRMMAWWSHQTGYPIPKEIAEKYAKINGNTNYPLPSLLDDRDEMAVRSKVKKLD